MIPNVQMVEKALRNAQQLRRDEKVGQIEVLKWTFFKITCSYKDLKPFNLFERAICGLLAVKSDLNVHQITTLLGFDAHDIAAQQLVKKQIELLQTRKLVYSGDLSACALTPQGTIFEKRGGYADRKVSLELYFDPLTPKKMNVHSILSPLKSGKATEWVPTKELSETQWKDFALAQRKVNIAEKFDFEQERYCKLEADVLRCEIQRSFFKNKRVILLDSQRFEVIPHCTEIWKDNHTVPPRKLISLLKSRSKPLTQTDNPTESKVECTEADVCNDLLWKMDLL